jgi:hypothetical protein
MGWVSSSRPRGHRAPNIARFSPRLSHQLILSGADADGKDEVPRSFGSTSFSRAKREIPVRATDARQGDRRSSRPRCRKRLLNALKTQFRAQNTISTDEPTPRSDTTAYDKTCSRCVLAYSTPVVPALGPVDWGSRRLGEIAPARNSHLSCHTYQAGSPKTDHTD